MVALRLNLTKMRPIWARSTDSRSRKGTPASDTTPTLGRLTWPLRSITWLPT